MILDIAYRKSFDVEWEPRPAALEVADDDDIDTLSWDVTDPESVPWKDLKLYAAAIVGMPEQRSPDVDAFIERMLDRPPPVATNRPLPTAFPACQCKGYCREEAEVT